MARVAFALLALVGMIAAAHAATPAPFTYDKSGIDWPGSCGTGESQSPVNIVMDAVVNGAKKELFSLEYGNTQKVAVINKGSTIQVAPMPEETHLLHLSSGDYKLLQMHVHAMSEHTVNGLFAPMEAHFVHVHVDDPMKLAVVGVMLRVQRHDQSSAWVDQWLPAAPAASGANVTVDVSPTFWSDLIDASAGFWTYPGSLTTPGCDEIVTWHVLRQAQPLSIEQSIQFMNMIAVTNDGQRTDNRFPQPLNGRTVYFYYPETAVAK
eukprot:TRINITY_DN15012_c0_g1_i1.p1 TRINITY_DN15012_c0_g1~~TRINITY_DN15012_c0_g1_i1.p1  ORF type:complete len:265 (-),score=12.84 TRINITY_DN15012_c0_g1_i1:319-1113(-)